MVAGLAIRSFALSVLALLGAWYALLGGRSVVADALPEISAFVPAAIVAVPLEPAGDPFAWLASFGTLFAAVTLLGIVQRSRRRRRRALSLSRPLAEEQLWEEHLVWLKEQRRGARGRVLIWSRHVAEAG